MGQFCHLGWGSHKEMGALFPTWTLSLPYNKHQGNSKKIKASPIGGRIMTHTGNMMVLDMIGQESSS